MSYTWGGNTSECSPSPLKLAPWWKYIEYTTASERQYPHEYVRSSLRLRVQVCRDSYTEYCTLQIAHLLNQYPLERNYWWVVSIEGSTSGIPAWEWEKGCLLPTHTRNSGKVWIKSVRAYNYLWTASDCTK